MHNYLNLGFQYWSLLILEYPNQISYEGRKPQTKQCNETKTCHHLWMYQYHSQIQIWPEMHTKKRVGSVHTPDTILSNISFCDYSRHLSQISNDSMQLRKFVGLNKYRDKYRNKYQHLTFAVQRPSLCGWTSLHHVIKWNTTANMTFP